METPPAKMSQPSLGSAQKVISLIHPLQLSGLWGHHLETAGTLLCLKCGQHGRWGRNKSARWAVWEAGCWSHLWGKLAAPDLSPRGLVRRSGGTAHPPHPLSTPLADQPTPNPAGLHPYILQVLPSLLPVAKGDGDPESIHPLSPQQEGKASSNRISTKPSRKRLPRLLSFSGISISRSIVHLYSKIWGLEFTSVRCF